MFCDFDEWCRKVLKKNWNDIPIYNDVKEIANDPRRFISNKLNKGEKWVLTSGYPCQPFSVSGNRRGEEDPRHIFPYIHRIVEQTRPTYCVFENVYGHVSMGLDEVLFEMERINYHTRQFVVSASSVGARHKRDRLWIICKNVGDTEYNGCSTSEIGGSNQEIARGSQKRSQETEQSKEQVDKKTMALYETNYPTPTTKGFGHASEGMTLIFRKKVENGELTEQEAQAMMNGVTLRPPRMKEWKYPTPNAGPSETQLQRKSRVLQEEAQGRADKWTWLTRYSKKRETADSMRIGQSG